MTDDEQQQPSVVIVGDDGTRHRFPPGFDPQKAAEIVRGGTQTQAAPQAAAPTDARDGRAVLGDAVVNFGKNVLRKIVDHPVESAATAGAIAAVPLTGGTSLIPMAAAAGLGGAGGAGLGLIAKAARGDADTPPTAMGVLSRIGEEGAIQAGMEMGGGLAGKGLEAAGRGLYRAALRPAAKLTEKYGDLVGAGLSEGAPVGASRAVQGKMLASKSATDTLVGAADAAGKTVPTATVTDQFMPLVNKAANREGLGVTGDLEEIAGREKGFNAAHPTGQIGPTRALELKREADALSSTAQNSIRRGAAKNDMTAQLHDATRSGLKQGLEDVAPGFNEQNARTSTMYGLSRALRSAENRPHMLTDMASLGTGIGGAFGGHDSGDSAVKGVGSGLAMKALMSPEIQSRLGIAADRMGRVPYAQLARLAMLAMMSDGVDEQGK